MKKFLIGFLKFIGILLLVIIVAVGGLFGYLTLTEYKPADTETLALQRTAGGSDKLDGDSFTVLGWNIGYAALGKESDFFMDGGTQTRPESKNTVETYLRGIMDTVRQTGADFCMLQEVDSGSTRSFLTPESEILTSSLSGEYGVSAYALNYKCDFVPVPIPPLGKVSSGLLTMSSYELTDATRVSLPCPFSWPLRIANLKRCLLVTRVPIAGSDKELVLVNLHLEAYDSGEGKIAQTKQLLSVLREEYGKGNYVVAGGDWNQIFPGTGDIYKNTHPELWEPGVLNPGDLDEGWQFVWDDSTPTCRLLNQPYNPSDTVNTQYYVIDGFLVSPNLEPVSVQTLPEDFACSDHNPVLLELRFAE